MLLNVPLISNEGWNYQGDNYSNFKLSEKQLGYSYFFPWTVCEAEYNLVDLQYVSPEYNLATTKDSPIGCAAQMLPMLYENRDGVYSSYYPSGDNLVITLKDGSTTNEQYGKFNNDVEHTTT